MPYIDKRIRGHMHMVDAEDVGELNYQITKLIDSFIMRKGLNYATLNSMIGVLECAKLELYRRVAAPYEDAKCEDNGDVYDSITIDTPVAPKTED
jgi:hypothetical protein